VSEHWSAGVNAIDMRGTINSGQTSYGFTHGDFLLLTTTQIPFDLEVTALIVRFVCLPFLK